MTLPSPSPSLRRKAGLLALRAAAIGWGALCLFLALQWFVALGMVGFPDGYISPYARQTSVPLHVLVGACTAQGLYFLVKGAFGRNIGASRLCLQILAAAIVTVAPVLILQNCPRSQACNSAYLAITGTMLDDGAGG
jgi:hypothetical protein